MYGTGTRSYNRSTEARANKLAQKVATESYLALPKQEVVVELQCTCRSFRLSHGVSAHLSLQGQWNWTPWEERYVYNAQYNCYDLKVQRWERSI